MALLLAACVASRGHFQRRLMAVQEPVVQEYVTGEPAVAEQSFADKLPHGIRDQIDVFGGPEPAS